MPLIPLFVQNELDASDTDLDNLLSAFNWCNPFDHILPFADGTIGSTDRAHLWGLYSGIFADIPSMLVLGDAAVTSLVRGDAAVTVLTPADGGLATLILDDEGG